MSPWSSRLRFGTNQTIGSWLIMAVVSGGYVVFRYFSPTANSLALSQLLYLLGPLLALVSSSTVVWMAPPRTRGRLVWTLLTSSMALLLCSESIYSWNVITGNVSFTTMGVADAVNLVALLILTAMMVVAAGVHTLALRHQFALAIDMLVLLVSAFLLLYLYWSRIALQSADLSAVVLLCAYSLAGVFLMGFNGFTWPRLGGLREDASYRLVALAIAIYGLGLTLWPLWRLAFGGLRRYVGYETLVDLLLLIGYLLVFVAGTYRTDGLIVGGSNRDSLVKRDTAATDVAVSLAASLGILIAGVGAYFSRFGSLDRSVFIGALLASSTLTVVRASLTAHDLRRIKSRHSRGLAATSRDPQGFETHLADSLSTTLRYGGGFALIMLETHMVKSATSTGHSDSQAQLMSRATASLTQRFERRGRVFLLGNDHLALIVDTFDSSEAELIARSANETLHEELGRGPHGIVCSVGYTTCPDSSVKLEALIQQAETALAWARRHRGGRVVAHSVALDRASTVHHISRLDYSDSHLDVVRALRAAADARDPAGATHAQSVASLSRLLSEYVGLDAECADRVQLAGLLHDVGRIALPPQALSPGTPASRGRAAAREHCAIGSQVLESIGIPGVAYWVRHHHERWDGNGYPDGLAGEAIPLESRILALANHYESTISGRRYGSPMSDSAAIQEIDLGLGTRFDPHLAESFIELVSSPDFRGGREPWSTE